jgi:DNA adenine methylase
LDTRDCNGPDLDAPFPWFGGKRRVAPWVWQAFGEVGNYVEPFFGSGAVLLGRPHPPQIETVNDLDGFVANAWRAIRDDPEAVAHYADDMVSECDLHAKHLWLVNQRDSLAERLMADMAYYDAQIAGHWLWGMSCWIGGEFCSGKGPWHSVDGKLQKLTDDQDMAAFHGNGISRGLVHLGNAGKGVHRRRVHLGGTGGSMGVHRKLVHLGGTGGSMGVHRKEIHKRENGLYTWMLALAERLRYVRVCCGDWTRVMGPAITIKSSTNGVFLDPPYTRTERTKNIYTQESDVAEAVRDWAIHHGDNPVLRIVLCGYEGEHEMPATWRQIVWKTNGGYANNGKGIGRDNKDRERLWLSPHCRPVGDEAVGQLSLLDMLAKKAETG